MEVKQFEKYGARFEIALATEKRPEWKQVYRLPDGTPVDTQDAAWSSKVPLGTSLVVDWELSGCEAVQTYVASVTVYDGEDCVEGAPLSVLSTADGPILGIVLQENAQVLTLLDPCVVSFDDVNGAIKLLPIFNVARTVQINNVCIRAVSPPSELLVTAYPGFMIKNRMSTH
jgi:hypothetical protein